MLRECWMALIGLPLVWSRVSLVENGYEGLVVAISPEEEENPVLVDSIKDLLTKASAELPWERGGSHQLHQGTE